MVSKILLVEDNVDLQFNLKILLEDQDFKVIIAKNGTDALEKLSKIDIIPKLIISDIMMPDMNGYELYDKVSKDPKYSQIPFIFLSALSSPKDISYGRVLGVSDYLTKPIDGEDLIRVINEKLDKINFDILIYNEFRKISSVDKELNDDINYQIEEEIYLLLIYWDDIRGPVIKDVFPKDEVPVKINRIASQLFHAVNLIYGRGTISKSETLLLNLENLDRHCFLQLDSYPETSTRHKKELFMLAIIAPVINYLNSLELKSIFKDASKDIKDKKINLEFYWKKILKILSH